MVGRCVQNNWIILKGYLSNQCTDSYVRGTQLSQALAPWFNIGNRCPVAIMPCTCQPTDFLATTDRNINLFWRFLSMSSCLAIDVHLKFQAIIVSWNKFQMHHWNYHGAPNKYGLEDDGFFLQSSCSHLPWRCGSRCYFGCSLAHSKGLEAALWSISQGGQAAGFVVAWAARQVNPFGVNVTANVRGTTKCAGEPVDLGYSIAKKVGLYTVFTRAYGFMQSQVFGGAERRF